MAYEVTATRRRPQTFNDLVGQEFVAATLKNSIQSGTIAHAYLFSGPRGCGKTSSARILAKALNCKNGPTATPCGECEACKEITAGSSLDVIEIDGASNTSVNDVRQIKDEVLFPPTRYRYKVYIIDEVHMLSTSAFNALLKTIEEPPPYVVFIFATTELQKVPATIKSRCQQFNFRLVPIEKVKDQLAAAAKEIGIKAEDEALYWIAREATGSMRDSYTLFDQVAAFSDGEITYQKIHDKLGLVGIDRLNELFSLCVQGKSSEALLQLDEYLQNGVSIEQLVTNCADYLRNILLIKNGVKKESLLGQSAERFSAEVVEKWSSTQIERALSIFMQLYRDLRYSLSPRYEFELAVSRLCWLSEYVSSSEVKKALDSVRPLFNTSANSVSGGQNVVHPPRAALQTAGLPQFSALAQMGTQNTTQKEENSPFYNGGFSAQENPETYAPAPEGEEPPLNNAPLGVSNGKTETQELSVSNEENSHKQEEKVEQSINPIPIENIEKVKEALISEFRLSDAMISSVLEKTKNWKYSENEVSATVDSQFEVIQARQYAKAISAALTKCCGKNLAFVVKYEEKKEKLAPQELPEQVTLVRDIFKGEIL